MEKFSIWYWDDPGMPLGCPWDASPATETGKNARIWTKIKDFGTESSNLGFETTNMVRISSGIQWNAKNTNKQKRKKTN